MFIIQDKDNPGKDLTFATPSEAFDYLVKRTYCSICASVLLQAEGIIETDLCDNAKRLRVIPPDIMNSPNR